MSDQKIYPTSADANGFFYETAEEFEQGIITKDYENGNRIKEACLSDAKVVRVRELKAIDTKEITRFMDKDPEKYILAGITVATQFNGERKPIEEVEQLKMKDYNKLLTMYQALNF